MSTLFECSLSVLSSPQWSARCSLSTQQKMDSAVAGEQVTISPYLCLFSFVLTVPAIDTPKEGCCSLLLGESQNILVHVRCLDLAIMQRGKQIHMGTSEEIRAESSYKQLVKNYFVSVACCLLSSLQIGCILFLKNGNTK